MNGWHSSKRSVTRTVLLDGDTFIYQAALANEYEHQWDENLWTLHAEFEPAAAQLDKNIQEVQDALKADELVVAMTDELNWRKEVMPTYKGHRKDRKPIIYRALRAYVAEKYRNFQRPKLEGDDILGILMTNSKIITGEKIMVSIDKDLKTVPGNLVDWKDPERTIRVITEEEADRNHLYQTLTGDTTDGYPGCPGIGPKTAEKLFEKSGATWETVLGAFQKAGLGEEVALMNARVARIVRSCDYDYKQMRVRLWQPN